jgi:predicted nucleic acid-binding protein
MTAIECLKMLRKLVLLLLVWNVVLSFCIVAGYIEKQEIKHFQKICNLEAIPPYEILEEK